MAAAYVKIYVNKKDDDHLVRTYGGNERDVKHMAFSYLFVDKNVFLNKHPYFTEICKNEYNLIVVYVKKCPRTYKQIIIDKTDRDDYITWLIGPKIMNSIMRNLVTKLHYI